MKTAIIYSENFPYSGNRPSPEQIEQLKTIGEVISPPDLAARLESDEFSALVNLHGCYFPKNSWKGIMKHLRRGRGLVNIGSRAFRFPAILHDGKPVVEREQTAYHRDLNIRNIFEVNEDIAAFEINEAFGLDKRFGDLFGQGGVSEFSVKFTHSVDKPQGSTGSSGPMEANIPRPLHTQFQRKAGR